MSTLTTIQPGDLITNSRADINDNFSALNTDKMETSVLDTDTTLAANSDAKVATQKAVKAYVDAGGNVNASTTTKGIVELATSAEIDAGTATGGTGASLVVTADALKGSLAPILRKYENSGSPHTWSKPAGLKYVVVEVVGGGGGGGGSREATPDQAGNGGGGGGYSRKIIGVGSLGSTETVTVGIGGAGGAAGGGTGTTGGTTSFGTHCSATGGTGGTTGASQPDPSPDHAGRPQCLPSREYRCAGGVAASAGHHLGSERSGSHRSGLRSGHAQHRGCAAGAPAIVRGPAQLFRRPLQLRAGYAAPETGLRPSQPAGHSGTQ